MIRRLKEDIREIQGGFPRRNVTRIVIDDLPEDTPELELSRLLDEYRSVREERFATATARGRAAARLLVVGLQQRLLSSIEAFAISLARHRKTVKRQWEKGDERRGPQAEVRRTTLAGGFLSTPGADDEVPDFADSDGDEEEAATAEGEEEEAQLEAANREAESGLARDAQVEALWREEQRLLDRMQEIADSARLRLDEKTKRLIRWIRENLCPELPEFGSPPVGTPRWNERRVLIFTEHVEGTKRFLRDALSQAIEGTDRCEERIAVIEGRTSGPMRKEIQRRFNAHPSKDPLRILLATDAAREGLNFQAHCTDLFHFDLPWNPGRIEQRNGRIDRKLQPAGEVRCHYFTLPQRHEDRVLEVLVTKTETIKKELGSLSKVIEEDIETRLKSEGIRRSQAATLATKLEALDLDAARKRRVTEEFEAARERRSDLEEQIEHCRNLLEKSRDWVGFRPEAFRRALSCSLGLQNADPLREERDEQGRAVWSFPALDGRVAADPSWASTLDTLRTPIKRDQKVVEWRREAPVRPVVFKDPGELTDDVVHVHLEQRVAQRLLARFRAQGFVHHDLSRACLAQVADSIPRVVLLGRLSLYGKRAERLHEEIVTVSARWMDPGRRDGPLQRYQTDAERRTLALLDSVLEAEDPAQPSDVVRERLLATAPADIRDLRPQLDPRAKELATRAEERLRERGEREATELRVTLERQRDRVAEELRKHTEAPQLALDLGDEDRRQLQANIRSWRDRLDRFEEDLREEPERIRDFYRVRTPRVEPVGLVYLWPETG